MKVELSPEQERELTDAYVNRRKGKLIELSRKWSIPDASLSRHALHYLKLPRIAKYAPHNKWTELELDIIEKYPFASDARIAWRIAQLTGRRRTPKSVQIKRSRLDLSQIQPGDDDNLSILMVAAGMGIDSKTVYRWVESKSLVAFKRGNGRWYVKHEDLKAFLLDRKNWRRWNVRKADDIFLKDLMSDGAYSGVIQHVDGKECEYGFSEHRILDCEAA